MLSKRRTLTLLPAVILALTGWIWIRNRSHMDVEDSGATTTLIEREAVPGVSEPASGSPSPVDSVDQAVTRLRGELERLMQVNGEIGGQKIIVEMFQWLEAMPDELASEAIVQMLGSREDALAFGRFAPGKDGFLQAYPSFRTALLDQLEKLSPEEAVRMGRTILIESENPDEWALSLRILTRHAASGEDRAFLRSKVQDLLHKDVWLEDPTFSFLHAFDAAVVDGNLSTLTRLADLVESAPNNAVTHAATVALDRLFQEHTSESASYVASHPDFLNESPGLRASLMARIDPTDTSAVSSVESYLANSAFSTEEKRTFFQLFPNFNTTFSYNLIRQSTIPTRTAMRDSSVAAVDRLSSWANDNQYPEFQDDINRAIRRLAEAWKLEL